MAPSSHVAGRYPDLLDELKTRMAEVFLAVQAGFEHACDDAEALLEAARSAETRDEAPGGGEQRSAHSTRARDAHTDGAPT